MRGLGLGLVLLLASVLPDAVLANWTASGTFRYRDREFDRNGFTGSEPALPARYVDVEVVDAGSGSVLASGATNAAGAFVVAVSDASVRTVYVRGLTRSTRTPSLFQKVTNGTNAVYSVASPSIPSHNPNANVLFGTLVAEPGAGGEAFNLYDVAVYGADFIAFLQGSHPGHTDDLEIQWGASRGATSSTTSGGVISQRDTSGYDDTVLLHEYGHYAVFAYGESDNPAGSHALADCNQDPRLAWDEGFASAFGGAVRRHFGLPFPHIYVRTTGAPGPGNLALFFDLETEVPYSCSGSTSEVSVYTALWDMGDSAATADETPGTDDGPVDTMARGDGELWEVMTDYLPDRTYVTAEDYWDGWFNSPASNGDLTAMRLLWGEGVEIRYFPDGYEPNEDRASAALLPVDGVPREATFFRDPDGNGSGTDAQDLDFYKFSAVAGWTYVAETTNLLSACDTQLRIQNGSGTTLASNDDRAAGDPSSLIPWTAPASGTFYVQAFQASSDATPYGSYALTLRVTPDADGDGRPDGFDNCPAASNPDQTDGDADGRGNACDNCPTSPNSNQLDGDVDGLGNVCDPCPADPTNDPDGDTVCGGTDNCPASPNPGQENADGDTLGDACDACPQDAANDADGDSICGDVDNCPALANPGQEDADGDTLGDACDPCPADPANDGDADVVCGDVDNCDAVANPGQEDADGDGLGDACDPDRDGDGVDNTTDCDPDARTVSALPAEVGSTLELGTDGEARWTSSARSTVFALYRGHVAAGGAFAYNHACIAHGLLDPEGADPAVPGAGELFYYLAVGVNRCGEGPLGEAADGGTCPPVGPVDSDDDGIADLDDVCAALPDPDQDDADLDGRGDLCDLCPQASDPEQRDADGDARGDACDACPGDPGNDADADAVCGDLDNCPDVPNPGQEDADEDGIGDACAP